MAEPTLVNGQIYRRGDAVEHHRTWRCTGSGDGQPVSDCGKLDGLGNAKRRGGATTHECFGCRRSYAVCRNSYLAFERPGNRTGEWKQVSQRGRANPD